MKVQDFSLFEMGQVELDVSNIEEMKNYYHEQLGLDILTTSSMKVALGKNKRPLIVLHKKYNRFRAPQNQAGLYHFAILFSSRGDLARTVERIIKSKPHTFTGSADHLVSEAFYFSDPEGNGIELYFDRDTSEWEWKDKLVKMAVIFLDPMEYISRFIGSTETNKNIKMGHVHLKVGDLEKAKKFYVDMLGFDVTATLPGALFVSRDGYHHHLGLNTWECDGLKERELSLGLKQFEIILPNKNELDFLKLRIRDHGLALSEERDGIRLEDPWKNSIIIHVNQV